MTQQALSVGLPITLPLKYSEERITVRVAAYKRLPQRFRTGGGGNNVSLLKHSSKIKLKSVLLSTRLLFLQWQVKRSAVKSR